MRLVTDLDASMRAFDRLGLEGPRVVARAFRALAQKKAGQSGSGAPGRMYGSVSVRDYSSDGVIALFYGPHDIEQFGQDDDGDNLRVAWWTSKGTSHQRAQHWFKRTSKSQRTFAIAHSLNAAARQAGFDVSGGSSTVIRGML